MIIIFHIYKLELFTSVNIMICGYENIYDLCENKYNYQYYTFTNNGSYILAASGDLAPVIRIDKSSGQRFLLNYTDPIAIDNCVDDTSNENILAWECYQIYRNSNKYISFPDLNDYKNAQKQYILEQYDNLLNAGILINIDDFITSNVNTNSSGSGSGSGSSNITLQNITSSFSIRLPSTKNDQIYYSNIITLINLWYSINSNAALPKIMDFYNRAHELSYTNLNNILIKYFKKLKEYSDIKDDLLNIIDKALNVSDIQRAIFYTSRQISSSIDKTIIT